MSDKKLRQLMQEALDGELSPENEHFLKSRLAQDQQEASHYIGLKEVDTILRNAPFERAPRRLALKIMARVAEAVKAQRNSESAELALSLSVAVVSLAMMPVLVAASWLVLNGKADPEVLIRVIEQMIALLAVILKALETLLAEAEMIAATDPETAQIVMALIPLTLMSFVNYMEENLAVYASDMA